MIMELLLKTNLCCPKCGKELYTSDIEGYPFVCLECDENFYGIETRKPKDNENSQDTKYKLYIPITEEKYKEFLVKYENHRMMADILKRYEKIYRIIDSITYNHKEKICTLALTQIPSEEDINQYKMLCGIE